MAQVWLITGSARGLGRAIAEGVLAAGDKLIATRTSNPASPSSSTGGRADTARSTDYPGSAKAIL